MEAHERYEELAVGHVLGGLDAADAAAFRSHLLGCRDCRLRVAELRDIAADLAAAEREERAEARVRTEVARRVDVSEDEDAEPRGPTTGLSTRALGVAAVLAAVLLGLLAFWNLHLRTQGAVHAQAADRSTTTLRELAEGVPVALELSGRTTGIVVVDGEQIAFTFAQLPALAEDERLVLWLLGTGEGDLPTIQARPDERGALAGTLADEGATELVLTVETGALAEAPSDREVVRAELEGSPQLPG